MFYDKSWKPFILGLKGQRSRSRVTKQCRCQSLHSCECWLLPVRPVSISDDGGKLLTNCCTPATKTSQELTMKIVYCSARLRRSLLCTWYLAY